jgi:hypothetical protein
MPKAIRVNITPRASVSAVSTQLDPILAAIENHKRSDRSWLDLATANGDENIICTQALEAAETAARNMPRTNRPRPPTSRHYWPTSPPGRSWVFRVGEAAWQETAFRTAVKSLADITGASKLAA